MLSTEQHQLRATRIGSSEIGAVLRIDPYKGPLDLFTRKLFGKGEAKLDHQQWGDDMERPILQNYARRAPMEALELPGTVVHPRYPWLCATPDFIGRTLGSSRRLVEAKNLQRGNPLIVDYGEPGTDQAPLAHVAQVTVSLGVLLESGLVDDDEADLVPSILGAPPERYRIRYDPELLEVLAERAREFVVGHLETALPPPLDYGSEAVGNYLAHRYPQNSDLLLPPTDEDLAEHAELLRLEKLGEDVEAECEAIRQRLKSRIGEAAGIEGIATWKLASSTVEDVIDWQMVAQHFALEAGCSVPDSLPVIRRFTRTQITKTGSRRFLPLGRPKKPRKGKAKETT